MRLMTFNLRFATPIDGPNEWEFRKDLVVEVIGNHLPDLLGTQEGTVPQLHYLEAASDRLPAINGPSPGGPHLPVSHHFLSGRPL